MRACGKELDPSQPHELEVNSNKVQSSYLVGWWNYKVVKEKVVELIKDMPPTQLGHQAFIKKQIQYIKRQK